MKYQGAIHVGPARVLMTEVKFKVLIACCNDMDTDVNKSYGKCSKISNS